MLSSIVSISPICDVTSSFVAKPDVSTLVSSTHEALDLTYFLPSDGASDIPAPPDSISMLPSPSIDLPFIVFMLTPSTKTFYFEFSANLILYASNISVS